MRYNTKLIAMMLIIMSWVYGAAAAETSPYTKPDGAWISLSGEITSVGPNSFKLDYGDAMVTIEMDDWDRDADAVNLMPGEQVHVYGRVDDDLWELTTIEAATVYVSDRNSYYFASAADEEAFMVSPYGPVNDAPEGSNVYLTGTVTKVEGREFWMDTGASVVEVDTIELGYNPMDSEGIQQIQVGDVIRVSGELKKAFLDNKELHATAIVTLLDASTES